MAYEKVRIFVASPGDVGIERERLQRVVDTLNRTGSRADDLGLQLELLRWETHVPPDVGRPQGVVFDRLPPDGWDIFIGLLWTRFGSKTGRLNPETGEGYGSGTEEEFSEALQIGEQRLDGWPKIMFYRRIGPPEDLLRLDGEQWLKVQAFFRQFEADGAHPGLVVPYKDPADFERIVRDQLEDQVVQYAQRLKAAMRAEGSSQPREPKKADGPIARVEPRALLVMPGFFRYAMDWYLPRAHTWLTSLRRSARPPEWRVLNKYLTELATSIADKITERTYIEPRAKMLPEQANRYRHKRDAFLTPIQQLIKEVVGVSHGGDAQSAQISAISKKSKFVRNMVRRLLQADEPLVLLGDPGTGKSMTLQQAAMIIAERESKRVFPSVCLFLRLGEFRVSGHPEPDDVWRYVKRNTPPDLRPYIDDLDATGRLIIFFDGLDEMSRERYNEHTTALSRFAGSRRETKTLFSCRVTDFTPEFRHNRLVLLPFSRAQIQSYLKRQMPSFPVRIEGADWSAKDLASRLAQGNLPMQADNPFVLWLFCTYLQEEETWPKSRVHLLEYYNRRNYERKVRDADPDGPSFPETKDALRVWGRIAYEITERNEGAGIALADVHSLVSVEQRPAVEAGVKCGVLQKSLNLEGTPVRFEHHRFQEYFTALYLQQHPQERATLNWLDKLDAPRWQETLFNLVLMGGGDSALAALSAAIQADLERLEHWRSEAAYRLIASLPAWSALAVHLTAIKSKTNTKNTVTREFIEDVFPPADVAEIEAGIEAGVFYEKAERIGFQDERFLKHLVAVRPDSSENPANDKLVAVAQQAIDSYVETLVDARLRQTVPEAAATETMLADRVELASRVLQQVRLQGDEILANLAHVFRTAACSLADHGNPITKVKMLWASRIVPDANIFRVAREPLASPVSWVQQQALIVASVSSGAFSDSEQGDEKDPLHNYMLISFASGSYAARLPEFIGIAAARQRATGRPQTRLRLVVALGAFLALAQILVAFGLVVTARSVAIPAFSVLVAGQQRMSTMVNTNSPFLVE